MSTKKPKQPKMKFEFVLVTPKMAAAWLAKQNTGDKDKNRHLRLHDVAAFARAMKAGLWRVTHQAISLDENGNLLDGQHRLAAIVESGVSLWMLVCYEQPRDNMSVIDRGKSRRRQDTLRIIYGMDHSKIRGTVGAMVLSLKSGDYGCRRQWLDEEVAESELIPNVEHYNWIFEIPSLMKLSGPVLAALCYVHHFDPKKVQEFAALIIEPANVPAGSIIFRAKEIAESGCRTRNLGGSERTVVLRRMLRCLMAYFKGEKLKLVKDSNEGLNFFVALLGGKQQALAV